MIIDEYLDVVDSNNNVLYPAEKSAVHAQNLLHRASHIIVKYKNTVFLQLRCKSKQQFPNKWDVSCAGHVISGESYYSCATRELKEELGLIVNSHLSQLIEIDNITASAQTGFEFIKLYLVDYSHLDIFPKLILQDTEITTGGWFEIGHITDWLKKHPDDFAGCFDLVWQSYLKYINQ